MALSAAALLLSTAAIAFTAGLAWARRDRRASESGRGRPSLEGRRVIVNTPKPDDQAIRGVVVQELEDGGYALAAAEYLEPAQGGTIREVKAGDVIVPRASWIQLVTGD